MVCCANSVVIKAKSMGNRSFAIKNATNQTAMMIDPEAAQPKIIQDRLLSKALKSINISDYIKKSENI